MQQEYSIVIIDTSCLILLSKIDELDLLKEVFKEIYTTNDVLLEFGNPLPSWILVKSPTNKNYQNLLELEIDKGEASAISLIESLEFFFWGPGMTLIPKLYKLFKLNSQCLSFFNGCLEGLLKMSWVKFFPMISSVSKDLFQAD